MATGAIVGEDLLAVGQRRAVERFGNARVGERTDIVDDLVDVGARQTVFRAIRDAAQSGACVLCASSDADQLAEICDRVLVLARGRVAAEIVPPALSKHEIIERCYGAAA